MFTSLVMSAVFVLVALLVSKDIRVNDCLIFMMETVFKIREKLAGK